MANRIYSPELLDTSHWPTVDLDLLSGEDQIRFTRLQRAVQSACEGMKSGEIAKRFGVSSSLLSYYIQRCTRTVSDGRLSGFRALVKGGERFAYTRTTEDANVTDRGAGLAGAFTQLLLKYEKSAAWLASQLEPKDKSKVQPGGLRISLLHQLFLDKLRKEGCSLGEYPFIAKRNGYEAFANHINKLINQGSTALAIMKHGESAAQAPGKNLGKLALLRPVVPFERVAYDEYKLPDIATITITNEEEDFSVPISRGYFCPVVDCASFAVLGFSFSIAESFNSKNLTQAFENSINPPPCAEHNIFEDLPLQDGQGLPFEVVPNARGRRISILCLDNHVTHFANDVLIGLRKRSGVAITFGKVRSWIERNVVERIFSWLQQHLKNLPSTTGSGPGDHRVSDPVGNAIKHKINISAIVALIEKLVRRYNSMRLTALFGASPNERIARDWSDRARLQIVPTYAENFVSEPNIAIQSKWVTVRGNRATHRTPYVQLDNVEYTNDILRQSWSLIGKKLLVKIGKDYRTVLAFREDGSEFGKVSVSGSWSLRAHTREVRQEINRLIRKGQFDARSSDPVLYYQEQLADKALKEAKRGKKSKITKEANKLALSIEADSAAGVKGDLQFKTKSDVLVKEKTLKPSNRRDFFSKS